MAAYVIIDVFSGYIWGDTRDIDGEAVNCADPLEACRLVDRANGDEWDEYFLTWPSSAATVYIVFRVDIDGSEAIPVVRDGRDRETIKSVLDLGWEAGVGRLRYGA